MPKFNLLIHPDAGYSFKFKPFNLLVERFFNVLTYQPDVVYNKNDTLVLTKSYLKHNPDALRTGKKGKFWYEHFRKQGFKIVVDNLWEDNDFLMNQFPTKHLETSLVLENINWFWYYEAAVNCQMDQNSAYAPDPRYNKYRKGKLITEYLAFMPIGRRKDFRTTLVNQLRECNLLDTMLWSYREVHHNPLPGDAFHGHMNPLRWVNANWYDNTYFTVAAETYFDRPGVFITEKTFKPIAYYHPFIIAGQPGTLAHLKSIGFETYDNLFDESYDEELDHTKRMSMIINNVQSFKRAPYDKLTIKKLHHNRNHFYDMAQIQQRVMDEIINPMLEYAES
jgi:hypothetical protein